jgi:three-Cys-motif partner protein
MPDLSLYTGREQTYVKHFFLEQYLSKFAHIIGWTWRTIAYVDCFSGPWEARDPELADTSFAIAVATLRKARMDLATHGREPRIRCLFLEKNPSSFARLSDFAANVTGVEAVAELGALESSVQKITRFVAESGPDTFSFIFIDPTGWTGFALDTITPLLRLKPGEVLINFMTHHIRRFIDVEESAESFIALFGSDIRTRIRGLSQQEREEALVGAYMRAVKSRGDFTYVGSAIVLKPEVETTHFHLIYATRHDRGVDEFKKVEKAAMDRAAEARALAKERRRFQDSGQLSMLQPTELHPSMKANELRQRYLSMARRRIETLLEERRDVEYRSLWRRAVAYPLVWESDLRDWLKEWLRTGFISIEGLKPRQLPSKERNETVRWRRDG